MCGANGHLPPPIDKCWRMHAHAGEGLASLCDIRAPCG